MRDLRMHAFIIRGKTMLTSRLQSNILYSRYPRSLTNSVDFLREREPVNSRVLLCSFCAASHRLSWSMRGMRISSYAWSKNISPFRTSVARKHSSGKSGSGEKCYRLYVICQCSYLTYTYRPESSVMAFCVIPDLAAKLQK